MKNRSAGLSTTIYRLLLQEVGLARHDNRDGVTEFTLSRIGFSR